MDRKCSSYVTRVAATMVRDLSVFLSCAMMRTTTMTAARPLDAGWSTAVPFGLTYSSSTGVGSLTSQSSSSICSGLPKSKETTLQHV